MEIKSKGIPLTKWSHFVDRFKECTENIKAEDLIDIKYNCQVIQIAGYSMEEYYSALIIYKEEKQ